MTALLHLSLEYNTLSIASAYSVASNILPVRPSSHPCKEDIPQKLYRPLVVPRRLLPSLPGMTLDSSQAAPAQLRQASAINSPRERQRFISPTLPG